MRQKIRKGLSLISLLLFPITINFFSPYVSIDGAMTGIISGSLLLFIIMFITATFFGRVWCGFLCPMSGLSEMTNAINNKNVNIKKLRIIRYTIFAVWFGVLISMFVLAGGIKGINLLHLTENFISVDMPQKYVIYYVVLVLFLVLSLSIGKRGACHTICWMSPFLVGGYTLGKFLRIPQLRVVSDASKCVGCGICNKKCPMSIDVISSVKEGCLKTSDCILCGECVDGCNKKVLKFSVVKTNSLK